MARPTTTAQVREVRRTNLIRLLNQFIDQQRRETPVIAVSGMEARFAKRLGINPSLFSGLKSTRPMGDGLARRIEAICSKPPGWMDRPWEAADGADLNSFLAAAEVAYQDASPEARKRLEETVSRRGELE